TPGEKTDCLMWPSLLLKLSMLALTMGVVFWIGWTTPSTVTRPDQSGVQSNPEPEARPPATVVSPPGSASSTTTHPVSSDPKYSGTGGKPEQAKLDLNRADVKELEELPGIGPVLAERIVDYRKSGNTFRSIDELREVKGIGKKKFEQIRALVMVVPTTKQPKKDRKAA